MTPICPADLLFSLSQNGHLIEEYALEVLYFNNVALMALFLVFTDALCPPAKWILLHLTPAPETAPAPELIPESSSSSSLDTKLTPAQRGRRLGLASKVADPPMKSDRSSIKMLPAVPELPIPVIPSPVIPGSQIRWSQVCWSQCFRVRWSQSNEKSGKVTEIVESAISEIRSLIPSCTFSCKCCVAMVTNHLHLVLITTPDINVSYHKCGVDRKTVVDTAAIAELEYCDAEAYKTLREKFHRGQKLSEFAKQCKEMCTREPLRSIIEEKKKNGMLIDLCQKKIT
ncbi:hypothetical protein DPX16_23152 [Anabarilius grahami]|uniref:Uncharacterized protein n=1 Tax=Anabarilius grahami TaxID=495550 RepID=A0A3N0XHR6_ANAGA|nr:hypothetical protein DPX16_23152 [Anabarilius grahami]